MALQSCFHRLHRRLTERDAFVVDLTTELDNRMNTLPGHPLGPLHHRLHIDQLRPIPLQLQDTPAPLNRIILAVIRRVIQQLNRLVYVVGKLHHTREKLCPPAPALWTVVHFDLEPTRSRFCLVIQSVPLGCEGIHDAVTGFVGAAEGDGQLGALFIHDPTRDILLLTAHIVITGLVVSSGDTATGKLADLHCGFTIHTPAFDISRGEGLRIFFLTLSKMASVSGIFFWGLALTTLRSRKPRRLRTSAMVLGEGNWSSP